MIARLRSVTASLMLLGVLGLCAVGEGHAQTSFQYTAFASELADATTWGSAPSTTMFGYDWDMERPLGAPGEFAPGFGAGSFYSGVTGVDPRRYTALRLNVKAIFGRPAVALSDLEEISYWTKNTDTSLQDWRMNIYTESTGPKKDWNGWYDHRFSFAATDGTHDYWAQDRTDGNLGGNYIKGYDGEIGLSYSLGDLALSNDWHTENILWIDIIAGTSDGDQVRSYLDGIHIGLSTTYWSGGDGDKNATGDEATINLEEVPEPGGLLLMGTTLIGLAGLGVWRRRK